MSATSANTPDAEAGAAQFIVNLSDQQRKHLQLSVPPEERFSVFLEEPRNVPVPKRFTIDPATLARLKEEGKKRNSKGSEKHARHSSVKSTKSLSRSSTGSDIGPVSRITSGITTSLLEGVERVVDVDWRFYVTGASLVVLHLVAAWDATMLPIALPTIATALRGSAFDTIWLGISSLLAATCVLPLHSTLSDLFGRKIVILVAIGLFALGTLLAAVSGHFTWLLLGRSVQGIGAGGLYILPSLIVSDVVSLADRRKWSARLAAAWAVGAVTGPVIGAVLTQNGKWRWIFWLQLPLCLIPCAFLAFFSQLRPAASYHLQKKLRNVDWFGFVLLSASLVGTFHGITQAGSLQPWTSFRTILPLHSGLSGLFMFLLWSWYMSVPALISLEGFRDRTKLVTYFSVTAQGMIVFAALYFLPLYLTISNPTTALLQISSFLLAWTVPLATFSLLSYITVRMSTLRRPLMYLGWVLTVVGVALMAILTRETPKTIWIPIAVMSGMGMGILYPMLSSYALSTLQRQDEARAVMNLAWFQTLGQGLGVAIGSTIFQNMLPKKLSTVDGIDGKAKASARDAYRLVERVRLLTGNDGAEELVLQVVQAYVGALKIVCIVMAVVAGLALIASFVMRKPDELKSGETKTGDLEAKCLDDDDVLKK